MSDTPTPFDKEAGRSLAASMFPLPTQQVSLNDCVASADIVIMNHTDVEKIGYFNQGEGRTDTIQMDLADETRWLLQEQAVELSEDGTVTAMARRTSPPEAATPEEVQLQFYVKRPLTKRDLD